MLGGVAARIALNLLVLIPNCSEVEELTIMQPDFISASCVFGKPAEP